MSKKRKSLKGAHFVYHCTLCRDIILVENQCDDAVSETVKCHASVSCNGTMIRFARDPKMQLPPTVYFYIWKDNGNHGIELAEKPGHPRIDRLHLAVKSAIYSESRV